MMSEQPLQTSDDRRGLSIDMLDADRLREWARLLLVHGADVSHWASVPHVVAKMQTLATNIETAIREIGSLRESLAEAERAREEAQRKYDDATDCPNERRGEKCGCQFGDRHMWHETMREFKMSTATLSEENARLRAALRPPSRSDGAATQKSGEGQ